MEYFNYQISNISLDETKIISDIKIFLEANSLSIDNTVEKFVVAFDQNNQIIACTGISYGIIKCVAISEALRGQNFFLTLLSETIKTAHELGYLDLFVYTSLENETFFYNCGFNRIAIAKNNFVLLENSVNNIKKYCNQLKQHHVVGNNIGSIVMNANPFTLGHRFLIEQATKKCDWVHVFLVQEDLSLFSFQDRLNLLKLATSDIKNITIHEGAKYIISRATFPSYFMQNEQIINDYYMELDLNIFRQYIAPTLNIRYRFVGTEPYSELTNLYNQSMVKILETENSEYPAIKVVMIERKKHANDFISASKVRKLIQENAIEQIKNYVPQSTFDFIISNYKDIKEIKKA